MTETDKDDLVARLRQFQADEPGFPPLFSRAAAEIERLRLQLAKAREALKPLADKAESFEPDEGDGDNIAFGINIKIGELRAARAALADDIGNT